MNSSQEIDAVDTVVNMHDNTIARNLKPSKPQILICNQCLNNFVNKKNWRRNEPKDVPRHSEAGMSSDTKQKSTPPDSTGSTDSELDGHTSMTENYSVSSNTSAENIYQICMTCKILIKGPIVERPEYFFSINKSTSHRDVVSMTEDNQEDQMNQSQATTSNTPLSDGRASPDRNITESPNENMSCEMNSSGQCDDDMQPIGKGRVAIPKSVYRHIDWTSNTKAIRNLLRAIFPRKVLATSSLTGKRSPAFPGKSPKRQLNPELIEDVVETIMMKCDMNESEIRKKITLLCADESKGYKTRLLKMKKRQ